MKTTHDVAFWGTKCNIVLAKHAMKNKKVSRSIRNGYYHNILVCSSSPVDEDIVLEFLVKERFLENQDGDVVITKSGMHILENRIIESEPAKARNNSLPWQISYWTLMVTILIWCISNLLKQ